MISSVTPRTLKVVAALVLTLSMAACAKDPNDPNALGAGGVGAGGVARPGSAQDFAQNVGDRVFFESDSSDLTPTAVATLDRQAQWLQRYRRPVLIEGHADERGTREYNFSLGARRGQTVREYLASRGVQNIRTVSYGKERPVAVCNDISCWSQNRRAVTVVEGGAGS